MKYLIVLLFLIGCSKSPEHTFKVGECFVDNIYKKGEENRIYQVMDSTEKTYIVEVISKGSKDDQIQWHPLIVAKYADIIPFDCMVFRKEGEKVITGFDKSLESYKKWEKAIIKLRKIYGIDK